VSDHGARGPQKHILRPTLSSAMVRWVLRWERQKRCCSGKKQGPTTKKCCYNGIRFGDKKMKATEKMKEWSNLKFFKSVLFVHILENSTHSLLVHGHCSWSTVGLHLVRGPKAL
jgi:hypothetical protein